MADRQSSADRRTSPRSLTPYVPADRRVPEFTVRAVVLGTLLSVAFGMVNAYLGLKVGLTTSASIPAAVLSMAVLRGILRRGTILENNVVQTIASAGDSLAAGVVFTIPALIFLGLDPSGFRIFLIAATAGLLGILMMIPLRHELTVTEHGRLPFPEGTACATVLIAGDRGRGAARPVFVGIALGAAYQLAVRGLRLWGESVFVSIAALHKLSIGAELSPLFLGVGYLIGARIAAIMLAGGLLAWVVLIPAFDLLVRIGRRHAARPAGRSRRHRRVADLARLRALRRRRRRRLRRRLVDRPRRAGDVARRRVRSCGALRGERAAAPPRTEIDLSPVDRGRRHRRARPRHVAGASLRDAPARGAAGAAVHVLLRRRLGAHRRPGRHHLAAGLRHDHHRAARHRLRARAASATTAAAAWPPRSPSRRSSAPPSRWPATPARTSSAARWSARRRAPWSSAR